ncbi:MAG: Xaa-Pro peptidase family protein [Desulfobacterales bacterium]|nr:Xaa-Pro peptidase family protein [Desulfobacterales bacterium]
MSSEYKRFAKTEYDNRWERARKRMAADGLDALFITEASNFTYFSGGHGDFSFSRPTLMVLPQKGNPVLIVHDFFLHSQQRESWVDDIRPYETIGAVPFDLLKTTWAELGLNNGRIGAELGNEQRLGLPYNDFARIAKELPGADFIDASDLFWGVRMVKSEAEVDCMRKACSISSQAFHTCFSNIRPGMTEKDAAKMLYDATVEAGGASAWTLSNSGPYNYESGFLPNPSEHILEAGNLLWLDTGCKVNGYSSDFSRIAAIGEPSSEQQNMYDIVNRITDTVVNAIRPGIKASDLSRLCNREFENAGLKEIWGDGDCSSAQSNRAQRIGHGIGMATTEPPHIALFDDTELQAGMVVTIEPTIATHYGHFNIESNVLVTEADPEVLSKATTELIVIA